MNLWLWKWIGIALIVVAMGGGCLVSDLHNGFDLKSPSGFFVYQSVPVRQDTSTAPTSGCAFDSDSFDTCSFGP